MRAQLANPTNGDIDHELGSIKFSGPFENLCGMNSEDESTENPQERRHEKGTELSMRGNDDHPMMREPLSSNFVSRQILGCGPSVKSQNPSQKKDVDFECEILYPALQNNNPKADTINEL
jgi:hypothetical protein